MSEVFCNIRPDVPASPDANDSKEKQFRDQIADIMFRARMCYGMYSTDWYLDMDAKELHAMGCLPLARASDAADPEGAAADIVKSLQWVANRFGYHMGIHFTYRVDANVTFGRFNVGSNESENDGSPTGSTTSR